MKLDHNQTSVYSLHYHLILTIKYRKPIISEAISTHLQHTFNRISKNHEITLQEWNHDKDHIHVLFKSVPKTNLTKFINSYKSASSRLVKQDYPEIREHLWGQAFWSRSYFLATTGEAPIGVLKEYIRSQGATEAREHL